ncbi:hypothetical protein Vadar_018133 [Vaccinium darrowii]|uniref:Uncharacterized protein n=1 Tax=Vaccinium darrowii TaxID=229202 RepID=A0ACB7YWE9_9ERIC|nr:hypothetical protein Vadar_018133 [Vaccinium darrowii]
MEATLSCSVNQRTILLTATCLRDLQVPDTQVVASKWINLYDSAFDERNSYMFRQPQEQLGCLISHGSHSYMFCQPKKQNIAFGPTVCSNPGWEATDVHKIIRGGVDEIYLVIKAFSNSTLEIFNLRTEERTIVVEYEGMPFSGYALLAYNLDGWILLNKDTKSYYYNVITRHVINLPDITRAIGPLAEGGFSSSPEDKGNVTIILQLNFLRALITNQWAPLLLFFQWSVVVDPYRSNGGAREGFAMVVQLVGGAEWRVIPPPRRPGYEVVVFSITDEGARGNLEKVDDFTGSVHAVRTTGGVISPANRLKLFVARSL